MLLKFKLFYRLLVNMVMSFSLNLHGVLFRCVLNEICNILLSMGTIKSAFMFWWAHSRSKKCRRCVTELLNNQNVKAGLLVSINKEMLHILQHFNINGYEQACLYVLMVKVFCHLHLLHFLFLL